jgi:hypothetical protein
VEQLARVVPLVERLVRVDALVALQPDQVATQDRSEHLRDLGLADPDLPFEQQRPPQRQRHVHGGREPAVGQVAALPQGLG